MSPDAAGRVLASGYGPVTPGRAMALSFVTVTELEFGARRAGWGPARVRRLWAEFARVQVVWLDVEVVLVYADLRAWCVAAGYGLGHKKHEADRW